MTKSFKHILMMLLILLLITGCMSNVNVDTSKEYNTINLYFVNQDKLGLVTESINIPNNYSNKDKVKTILQKLEKGPNNEIYSRSILEGIHVKDVNFDDIENGLVKIYFNNNYKKMSPEEEVLCRAAIVYTLSELKFIKNVEFWIENIQLADQDNKPYKAFSVNDFTFISVNGKYPEQKLKFTLYFANKKNKLQADEENYITVNQNERQEQIIMSLLMKGPVNKKLKRTIPKEAKLESNPYVENAICYIDFSEEFITKHTGGEIESKLTIYSIVNSLVKLPYINKVQFLIDSKKVSEFRGVIKGFDKPFESNTDIIEVNK